jgi:hypothetical protein
MDKVINQRPEMALMNGIRQARQLASEQKGAQRTSGASGQLNYTLQSVDTWDRTETVTAATSTQMTLQVTMTCDKTQPWPEALLYLDIRANGTGDSNKFSYLIGTFAGQSLNGSYGWTDNTNIITSGSMNRNFNNLGVIFTWTVNFFYKGTITYYVKPVIRASCGGTLALTRTL